MKIRKTRFKRPYAIWGRVYLPARLYEMPVSSLERRAQVEHERIHLVSQRGGFHCFTWLMAYMTDKEFRRKEESFAYAKQIWMYRQEMARIDDELWIRHMVEGYHGAFCRAEAEAVLHAAENQTPLYGVNWWEI